jgi:hypothetical protein
MQTCNPLTARRWFKLREPANWVVTAFIFAAVFFVLMQIVNPFIAAALCIGAAFCLFFFVLDKRAIGIVCPNEECGKFIETNTPWICGLKGCRNEHVDDFPFIYRCEHCGYYPKAYKCHHCQKLIFFTRDRQTINYAQCVNFRAESKPVKVKKDEHADTLTARKKAIERKELEAQEAKIDVELKSLRQSLETPKKKTIEDEYRAAVKNEDDERRLRAAIDVEFKNDDEERKRRHLTLNKIMGETNF